MSPMNLKKIRSRLEAIISHLDKIQPSRYGWYTKKQMDKVDCLNKEFEKLGMQIEISEKIESMSARSKKRRSALKK